jgi:hypothetical protein
VKPLSRKFGIVLVALSFLILTGCATTFGDLVRSKQEGKGTSRVYEVNVDQAWEIAKKVLQWEGTGEIKENRSEGYMATKSGSTLMGVWIEPIDIVQSRVTIITKSTGRTIIGLSETEFHEHFALFANGPENKQR